MTGRSIAGGLELAYAVCGGPLAWLAQMNLTYPLLATPCFPGPLRNLAFPAGARWAFVLAVVVHLALLAFALGAAWTARRIYKRCAAGRGSSSDHFEGAGPARAQFLAFCGMLLGGGFSLVILMNALALLMVPPCAI